PDLSGCASQLAQAVLPPFLYTTSASTIGISGLDHAAHAPAVYASRPRLPVCCLTAAQDSLPAGRSPLPVGTFTRRLLREVSVISYMASSSPRLCLAHVQLALRRGRRRPPRPGRGARGEHVRSTRRDPSVLALGVGGAR